MVEEIGQISFFLAKESNDLDSVLKKENMKSDGPNFKIRHFTFDDVQVVFICIQKITSKDENPPWIDFVNQQLEDDKNILFKTKSSRPSGVLLLKIENRILAACFGVSGGSLIDKSKFLKDFGIKAAMNMCGNEELRQTKSSTHAITTQNIDRQLSQPSDSFSFGMSEVELLRYISAHLKDNKKVTLQGKDSITIKVIGEDKLSWERLVEYGRTFIKEYDSDNYKSQFPNYPNLEDIPKETADELDATLVENLKAAQHDLIHLAIPEFLEDDKYSFSYTNYPKSANNIVSHIDVEHLAGITKLAELDIKKLKQIKIFAYSPEEDRILSYQRWKFYDCLVGEIEIGGKCYILSGGVWRKVDADFYNIVNEFIEKTLPVKSLANDFNNIDISVDDKCQNREEVFNRTYCEKNQSALLFDQAKLKVGQGAKDKEFCDILEFKETGPMEIIHVKKHGGSNALNYLFSQARFYCDAFLRDEIFLAEIRNHIQKSECAFKDQMLEHVKEKQSEVYGNEYSVGLWVLYDGKKEPPSKLKLPLMAKYELKIAYEQLRNVFKYAEVYLSMVPVNMTNYTKSFKNTPAR